MGEERQGKKYFNTVAFLVVLFFFLFVVWKKDAQYIIDFAIDFYYNSSARLVDLIPKLFLVVSLYIVVRLFSFVFVDIVMQQVHNFQSSDFDFNVTSKMTKFSIWFFFAIGVLLVFFENATSIITSLGLVGFGITFALQKPILNFVGWLTISFKRIYQIGDRIRIGDVRGDVREINMMNTVLSGLLENSDLASGKIVTLPNEIVLTGEVENYARSSNYIVEELQVGVTYESDFKKAQKLLYDIAAKVTRENKNRLKKAIMNERESLEYTILHLGRKLMRSAWHKKKRIEKEMTKLKEETKELQEQEDELQEEFKPKVRLFMKDSSIELLCQFITPYNKINANRTRIITLFLDAVAKERKIEVAYPHMELVFNKTTKFLKKK